MNKPTDIPNSVLLAVLVPAELSSNLSFPQWAWQVGDRAIFVQEEPTRSSNVWPYIRTFWLLNFERNFGASSILTWVQADTASAACPAQSTRLAMIFHYLLLQPSFEMQTNLFLWIQHTTLNRLSQCRLGARPGLCTFDTSVLTPHFCDDRYPSDVAKWTVLFSLFCASRMTSFFLFTLVSNCQAPESFQASPILCPVLLSHPDSSSLGA